MIENNGLSSSGLSAGRMQELLQWQIEMGADEAIGNAPVDRFVSSPAANVKAPANPLRQPRAAPPRPAPLRPATAAMSTDEAVLAARYLAHDANDLETLRTAMDKFEGCGLRSTAKQLVFADGNPEARIMFIGEAPGRDEDLQGLPFVGRAGKLLDKMLKAINIDRHAPEPQNSAYIANVVPWRPPGNRNPSAAETAICRPFIERQIELASPEIIVLLGGVAAKEMFKTQTGIMRLRGKWRTLELAGRKYKAIATFHPSFLLRSPAQKALAWRDFLSIYESLAG